MLPALEAAGFMILQDIFGVLLVQAEARNRGWLASFFDASMWLASYKCYKISLVANNGHTNEILLFVTLANIIGSRLGVYLGKRFIKEQAKCTCCPVHNSKVTW